MIKKLRELEIFHLIGALCFDTCASNTGWARGACVRIEREAPGKFPLVYLACRRHKMERDYNAAWKMAFPGPTKAPADKVCEKVKKMNYQKVLMNLAHLSSESAMSF